MADQRIRFNIPTFTSDIDSWLMHVKAFLAQTEATDQQKHNAVVGALPTEVATCVREAVLNPPIEGKFLALKTALLENLGRSKLSYLQELNSVELGGRRPSALLSHMKRLNESSRMCMPDIALKQMHIQKMPVALQLHLASIDDTVPLQEYSRIADRLFSQYQGNDGPSSVNTVSRAVPLVENNNFRSVLNFNKDFNDKNSNQDFNGSCNEAVNVVQHSEKFSQSDKCQRELQNLSRKVSELEQLVRSATMYSASRPNNPTGAMASFCFYHSRFGSRARKCTPPCNWQGNANGGGW